MIDPVGVQYIAIAEILAGGMVFFGTVYAVFFALALLNIGMMGMTVALLADLGAKQLFGMDRIKFYGTGTDSAMLAICIPYDEQAQHKGNGNMIAIDGGSREAVDKLYAKALELGATDEGEAGERSPAFYGAYVRDLDGNKLCFYEMKM